MAPLETVLLAVTAFASTNVDDAVLLIGLFSDARFRMRDIVAGQALGMAAIIVASMVAASVVLDLPPRLIAIIGVAPMLIGAKQLRDAWTRPSPAPPVRGVGSAATVAVVTLANGGDNVTLYTPLLAGRAPAETAIIIGVFAALLGLWCLAARALVAHRILGAALLRWGSRVMPLVLIGLGAAIVARGWAGERHTWTWLGSLLDMVAGFGGRVG